MFKNNIYKYLSKEDLEIISSEIKNVEQNTSAELVVSIKNKIPFLLKNDIYKFALYLFKFYKLFKTKDRTGVLILFVLKDRKFYILGDKGINEKINQKVWDDISLSVAKEIKENNLLSGVIHSIKTTSELVNYHFPKKSGDINELSNSVRF